MTLQYNDIKEAVHGMQPAQAMEVAQIAQLAALDMTVDTTVNGQGLMGTSYSPSLKVALVSTPASNAAEAVFYPPSDDTAGILIAAYAANQNGGGTVKLKSKTYQLTATLPIYPNVTYQGAAYGYSDNSSGPRGGTILRGDGTFNGIEWNAVDIAWTNTSTMKAGETFGAGVKRMSLVNFKNGVKIGALYAGGCNNLAMDEVYAGGCTEWGVYLENCSSPNIGAIAVMGNALGNFYMGCSGVSGWNYGDGTIKQIYCQAGTSGADLRGSIKSKGIVFEARGTSASLNDITVGAIGVNGWNGAPYTYTTTLTSGTVAIPVDDLSKLVVGSGITFGTTRGNVSANVTYFVLSLSAAIGAGTITISDSLGGTLITPNTTGTSLITCKGGTLLQVGGNNSLGTGNYITALKIVRADVEQCGTVGLLMQNVTSVDVTIDSSPNNNGIVLRNVSGYNDVKCSNANITLDADVFSKNCKYWGTTPTTILTTMPGGIRYNAAGAVDGLSIGFGYGGKTDDIYGGDASGFISINMNTPLALWHVNQVNGGLYSSGAKNSTGQVMTLNGATTLFNIAYDQELGMPLWLFNPTAGALSVTTANSQNILGLGLSVTTISVLPNTGIMLIPQKVGATYFWARYS